QSFVVYEERPGYAMEIFVDLVKHDVQGLAFIPNSPAEVKERHGLINTHILEVGERSTPTTFCYLSRDERDYVLYLAERFARSSTSSLILLGGLRTVLTDRSEEGLRFLKEVRDMASSNKSRLLLSVPEDIGKTAMFKDLFKGFVEL
ncbi:MAG: hypothetical protein KAT70_02190, partial [Thermoplasmata archaeon]|nr:hypothetical protein [Thermoplasmata archaeon]